ncbi:MAG TPA: cell division protein FtsQ/DivIB [Candidatus Omnitrophota bacterium]|jgi:cell division septal protein FtsQ|nr:cell division protein FtsQ/DivIB [Candidatus Omnitrophota bacterium]
MARKKRTNTEVKGIVKNAMIVIMVIAASVFLAKQTLYFFTHAGIFNVREIVKTPSLQHVDSQYLDHIVGRNIFRVDLDAIQRRVQAQYPSIDNLRIVRQLPNRIQVAAQKREPFAIAMIARSEAVLDVHGVVLEDRPAAFRTLPVIIGADDIVSASPGDRLRSRKLGLALKILKTMQEHPYLTSIKVRTMDVSNESKILLALDGYGDVMMDRYQVEQKLEQLGILLSQPNVDLKNISYIDLRFQTPIASTAKGK